MNTRKPLHRPLGDTEHMLEQWGYWRMTGMGVPSYVSPMWAIMRDLTPSKSNGFAITDDLALAVDRAVARLWIRDKQMGDIIWLYYGAKWPMVRVGRHFEISEGKARELARSASAWIDCALTSSLDAA